ncbi:plasmid maintenance system antidote protein [Leptospira biflexa serovar Patoc strain 'Patoc 1 (Ames)']|uniref:Addiction module antidote protein, HigA family n=2 Tax=Leptospira TaxID=171 RepID=A0ABY2NSE0_9LEPT|nr:MULTISPECIES: HigA family addiction module antitoxin [Leptospira]ABZ94667.1 plasmid maintenance system antidote protein [Leptospira biflexa serovar Patoc strain 'Patoc 1 (Ames)']ABZ98328.1 Putative lambda repressor-like DNA-binding protein [Leptospira biflexa serovar Patoc strain 'Patoc 1 (Paris)']TGM60061.1 addiction module antidote protein, HigA family [Leptospira vanthielii]
MKKENFINVHPGEILTEEFLTPLEISAYRLAKETGIPESNISEIINGKRSITAAISIKLGKFFELNPMFWIGLQNDYDIRLESHKLKSKIKEIKSFRELRKKNEKIKKVKHVA